MISVATMPSQVEPPEQKYNLIVNPHEPLPSFAKMYVINRLLLGFEQLHMM